MSTEPRFFIIGTKYARAHDKLRLMELHGVVSTGFVKSEDLSPLIGKTYEQALKSLSALLPKETFLARNTLARFISLRPGDIIALKAHSAPLGKQPRLVIARYAVVAGSTLPRYHLREDLGHSIEVDFLSVQEKIELPLGYGQTLHHIEKADRIKAIFGAYSQAAMNSEASGHPLSDKATHASVILSRGEYIMERVHNQLQNSLRARLVDTYGALAVRQEKNKIDLSVTLSDLFLLFEVKASPSPRTCVREALGQMLHYAWRIRHSHSRVQYVVVGPNPPADSDNNFIEFIQRSTGIQLIYCTPSTYVALNNSPP